MTEKNLFSPERKNEKHYISGKILEQYNTVSGGWLKKFRTSTIDGDNRNRQGQELATNLSSELFSDELNRHKILENNGSQERDEQAEEIEKELIAGMRLAREIGPINSSHGDNGKKEWRKAMIADYYDKEYLDGGEVRLKGYLLSTMLDCARWSNKGSALTQIIELWADNHYQNEEEKAEKIKEILADIMPLLNEIKAYAYVDATHPKDEDATNVFFQNQPQDNRLYYNETFHDPNNSKFEEDGKTERKYPNVGIKQSLEKYGFSGAEIDGQPIIADDINEEEKAEIKKKFLADLEQAQEIVNKERSRREEERVIRIGGLSAEIHSAERTVNQENYKRQVKGEKKSVDLFDVSDAELRLKQLKEEADKLKAEKKVQWSKINILAEKS